MSSFFTIAAGNIASIYYFWNMIEFWGPYYAIVLPILLWVFLIVSVIQWIIYAVSDRFIFKSTLSNTQLFAIMPIIVLIWWFIAENFDPNPYYASNHMEDIFFYMHLAWLFVVLTSFCYALINKNRNYRSKTAWQKEKVREF